MTRDYSRQAKVALAVFHARGKAAIAALENSEIEAADALLRKRAAAFHNFRALEALANAEGWQIAADLEMKTLSQELREIEVRLEALLLGEAEKARAEWVRIKGSREKLVKYRSQQADVTRFESSV